MTKSMAIIAGLLMASTASASDFVVDIGIPSGLTTTDGGAYVELRLDLNVGSRYFTANGMLLHTNGIGVPATGTCLTSTDGSFFCNVQVDQASVSLTINADMNGTILLKGADGSLTSNTTIKVTSVNGSSV